MRHLSSESGVRGGRVRSQSGFSLLELLVVVTLLGVVVVTALPRFLARETGADTAYLRRLAGDLETGAALFHAQWIAAGRPAPNAALEAFAGLRANFEGYPYGVDDHGYTGQGLATAEDCAALFRGLLGPGAPTVVAVPTVAEIGVQRAEFTAVVEGSECHYYLTRNRTGDAVKAEHSVLLYNAGRGRTELRHQVEMSQTASLGTGY